MTILCVSTIKLLSVLFDGLKQPIISSISAALRMITHDIYDLSTVRETSLIFHVLLPLKRSIKCLLASFPDSQALGTLSFFTSSAPYSGTFLATLRFLFFLFFNVDNLLFIVIKYLNAEGNLRWDVCVCA
jgi:hypothetical protein